LHAVLLSFLVSDLNTQKPRRGTACTRLSAPQTPTDTSQEPRFGGFIEITHAPKSERMVE
ncbi:MAG: hypothetical protein ACK5LO_16245, partial [Leucobacter sp.]